MNVTIKGNIATLTGIGGMLGVFNKVRELGLDTFTVASVSKAVYDLSFPMTRDHHMIFAGQIHRYNAENKLKKKIDDKGGKPDGTPPKGTPPRGGAGNTQEFVKTTAIAA